MPTQQPSSLFRLCYFYKEIKLPSQTVCLHNNLHLYGLTISQSPYSYAESEFGVNSDF